MALWQDAPVIEDELPPVPAWQSAPLVDEAAPVSERAANAATYAANMRQPYRPGQAVDLNPAMPQLPGQPNMMPQEPPVPPTVQPKVIQQMPAPIMPSVELGLAPTPTRVQQQLRPGLAPTGPITPEMNAKAAQAGQEYLGQLPDQEPITPASGMERAAAYFDYIGAQPAAFLTNIAHGIAQKVGLRPDVNDGDFQNHLKARFLRSLREPGWEMVNENDPESLEKGMAKHGRAEQIAGIGHFVGKLATLYVGAGIVAPAGEAAAGASLLPEASSIIAGLKAVAMSSVEYGLATAAEGLATGKPASEAFKEGAIDAGFMLAAGGFRAPAGTPAQFIEHALSSSSRAAVYTYGVARAQGQPHAEAMNQSVDSFNQMLAWHTIMGGGREAFGRISRAMQKQPKTYNELTKAMKSLGLPENASYDEVRAKLAREAVNLDARARIGGISPEEAQMLQERAHQFKIVASYLPEGGFKLGAKQLPAPPITGPQTSVTGPGGPMTSRTVGPREGFVGQVQATSPLQQAAQAVQAAPTPLQAAAIAKTVPEAVPKPAAPPEAIAKGQATLKELQDMQAADPEGAKDIANAFIKGNIESARKVAAERMATKARQLLVEGKVEDAAIAQDAADKATTKAEELAQAEKAAAEAKQLAEKSGATPPPSAEQVVAPSAKGGATAPEPVRQNFTQFAAEHGFTSDYDMTDHGDLSPSGKVSARGKDAATARLRTRIESNEKGHEAFQAAIDAGTVIDSEGRYKPTPPDKTPEALAKKARIEHLENDIDIWNMHGKGKGGKIRPTYKKAIDKAQAELDTLRKSLSGMTGKSTTAGSAEPAAAISTPTAPEPPATASREGRTGGQAKVVYKGISREGLQGAMESGYLEPQYSRWPGEEPSHYFTTNLKAGKEYAQTAATSGEPGELLRIKPSAVEFQPDPEGEKGSVRTFGKIPISDVEIYKNGKWQPLTKPAAAPRKAEVPPEAPEPPLAKLEQPAGKKGEGEKVAAEGGVKAIPANQKLANVSDAELHETVKTQNQAMWDRRKAELAPVQEAIDTVRKERASHFFKSGKMKPGGKRPAEVERLTEKVNALEGQYGKIQDRHAKENNEHSPEYLEQLRRMKERNAKDRAEMEEQSRQRDAEMVARAEGASGKLGQGDIGKAAQAMMDYFDEKATGEKTWQEMTPEKQKSERALRVLASFEAAEKLKTALDVGDIGTVRKMFYMGNPMYVAAFKSLTGQKIPQNNRDTFFRDFFGADKYDKWESDKAAKGKAEAVQREYDHIKKNAELRQTSKGVSVRQFIDDAMGEGHTELVNRRPGKGIPEWALTNPKTGKGYKMVGPALKYARAELARRRTVEESPNVQEVQGRAEEGKVEPAEFPWAETPLIAATVIENPDRAGELWQDLAYKGELSDYHYPREEQPPSKLADFSSEDQVILKQMESLGYVKFYGDGLVSAATLTAEPMRTPTTTEVKSPTEIVAELTERSKKPIDKTVSPATFTKDGKSLFKKLLAEVPEFAIDPAFTVNAGGNLVFRDGYKLTFTPEQFGIKPKSLKEGQRVGVELKKVISEGQIKSMLRKAAAGPQASKVPAVRAPGLGGPTVAPKAAKIETIKDAIGVLQRGAGLISDQPSRFATGGVAVYPDKLAVTDGHSLTILPYKGAAKEMKFKATNDKPVVIGHDGKPLKGDFPAVMDVVPQKTSDVLATFAPAVLISDLVKAEQMTGYESRGVRLYANPDGTVGVAASTREIGEAVANIKPGAKYIISVNPTLLSSHLSGLIELGVKGLELRNKGEGKPLRFDDAVRADGPIGVLMPVEGGEEGPMAKSARRRTGEAVEAAPTPIGETPTPEPTAAELAEQAKADAARIERGRQQAAVDPAKLPDEAKIVTMDYPAKPSSGGPLGHAEPHSEQVVITLAEPATWEQKQYLESLGFKTWRSEAKRWLGDVVPVEAGSAEGLVAFERRRGVFPGQGKEVLDQARDSLLAEMKSRADQWGEPGKVEPSDISEKSVMDWLKIRDKYEGMRAERDRLEATNLADKTPAIEAQIDEIDNEMANLAEPFENEVRAKLRERAEAASDAETDKMAAEINARVDAEMASRTEVAALPTKADIETVTFNGMAQYAPKTVVGVGRNKGKRYRAAKIVAVDENGQERTYNVQVSDSGERRIKDEGVTKEQFQKDIARDYAKLPEAARAVAEEYDANPLNRLAIAEAASGRNNKEIRAVFAGGKFKRQFMEKHPGITTVDAAMKALVADAEAKAQPGGKAETPEGKQPEGKAGKQPWEIAGRRGGIATKWQSGDATITVETSKQTKAGTGGRRYVARVGEREYSALTQERAQDWADAALAKLEKPEGKTFESPLPTDILAPMSREQWEALPQRRTPKFTTKKGELTQFGRMGDTTIREYTPEGYRLVQDEATGGRTEHFEKMPYEDLVANARAQGWQAKAEGEKAQGKGEAKAQTDSPAFKKWFGKSKVVDKTGKPLVVFHGTRGEIQQFDPEKLGSYTGAESAQLGFFFSSDANVAATYPDGLHEVASADRSTLPGPMGVPSSLAYRMPQAEDNLSRAEAATFVVEKTDEGYEVRIKEYDQWGAEFTYDDGFIYDSKAEASDAGDAALAELVKKAQAGVDEIAAREDAERVKNMTGANIVPVYLSMKDPLVHDFRGGDYTDQPFSELLQDAKDDGNDGVIMKNVADAAIGDALSDVYVVFNPTQIKSALGNAGKFSKKDPRITDADDPVAAAKARREAAKEAARNRPHNRRGGFAAIPDPQWLSDWVIIGLDHAKKLIAKAGKLAKIAWAKAMRQEDPDLKGAQLKQIWGAMVKGHRTDLRNLMRETRKATKAVPPSRDVTEEVVAPPASPDRTVGIKNAAVEQQLAARGLEPPKHGPSMTFEQARLEAATAFEADPFVGKKLVDDLLAIPKPVTAFEDAVLLHEMTRLTHEVDRAEVMYLEATQGGDAQATAQAQRRLDEAVSDYAMASDVVTMVGTESSHSLSFRRMMMKLDYSLAAMERRAEVANAGKPIAAEERTKIVEQARQIADLEQRIADVEVEAQKLRQQHEIDAKIKGTVQRQRKAAELLKEPTFGVENRVFTRDKAMAAKTALFAMLRGPQMALAPGGMEKLVTLGGFYVEGGLRNFKQWKAQILADAGDMAKEIEPDLAEAWKRIADQLPRIDRPAIVKAMRNAAGQGRALPEMATSINKIAESLIEGGIHDRGQLIDALHEILKDIDPALTRRETMDALSGYGDYRPLNMDATKAELRDYKGQLQQLAKLRDMQEGAAPAKTGPERRIPSDEERRLIQQVNETKRKGGFVVTDPATQLKSSLDAIKTRMTHQIADLELEIATRTRIDKTKTPIARDAEALILEERLKDLRQQRDEVFGKTELTDEQRIAAAVKALERSVEAYEKRITDAQPFPAKKLSKTPASPKIDALKARRDALKEEIKLMQDAADIADPARKDAILNQAFATRTANRIADLQERLAKQDFSKKPRRETPLTPASIKLQVQLAKVKEEYDLANFKRQMANRTIPKKILDAMAESLNLPKQLIASFDLSAVGRQGGILTISHPVMAAKIIGPSMKALVGEEGFLAAEESVKNHENYPYWLRAGLDLTTKTRGLAKMEETQMSRLASKIPGIRASERHYMTWLNLQRYAAVEHLALALNPDGSLPTADEAKVIAHAVNVMTGRGGSGIRAGALSALSTVFWAPRLAISRFQYLFGHPVWYGAFSRTVPMKGTGRVRWLLAKEYAHFLSKLLALIGVGVLMGGDVEDDPRSADFGKIRFGDTRVDPGAGLLQPAVFLSKMATRQEVTTSSRVESLTADNKSHMANTIPSTIGRFVQSKVAPGLGQLVNIWYGANFVGEKVTPATTARDLLIPLAIRDAYQAVQSEGWGKGSALAALSIMGMGLSTYIAAGPKTRQVRKLAYEAEQTYAKDQNAQTRVDQLYYQSIERTLQIYDEEAGKLRKKGKQNSPEARIIRLRQEQLSAIALDGGTIWTRATPGNRKELIAAFTELMHAKADAAIAGKAFDDEEYNAALDRLHEVAESIHFAGKPVDFSDKIETGVQGTTRTWYAGKQFESLIAGDTEAVRQYAKAREALGVELGDQLDGIDTRLDNAVESGKMTPDERKRFQASADANLR